MTEFLLLCILVINIILLIKKNSNDSMLDFYSLQRKLDKISSELAEIREKLSGTTLKTKTKQDSPIVEEIKTPATVSPPILKPSTQENIEPKEIVKTFPPVAQKQVNSAFKSSYSEHIKIEPSKGFWEKFKEKNPDLEKFIGENLISKIGIVILVLGISYLVKYAIDKDWINESGRVGVGILSGSILLGISHYLHKQYKAFSSILVAGAITVFYFTIAYGFHKYHLYPQSVAFGIMILITAFSTLISIYYDRQELAVLSVIGGFTVPFMVSNGEGNYIALFSYILILNIGMLLVSYFKHWNIVKILAFVFTHLSFLVWYLFKYPQIELLAHLNAFLFINAFYLLFLAMNIIDIIKDRISNLPLKVGFMLMNTGITYFVSMHILGTYYPQYKGHYTLLFSVVNLFMTYLVFRQNKEQKNFIFLLLGLTLTFATLAIPVQFDGFYVSLFWAAEALLLIWLSIQSGYKAFVGAGAIVFLLMLVSLAMDWGHYNNGKVYPIIFNSILMTGLFAIWLSI